MLILATRIICGIGVLSQLLWSAWAQYNVAAENPNHQFWHGGLLLGLLVNIPFLLVYFVYRCGPFLAIFFASRPRDTRETKVVYLIGATTLIVIQVWAIASVMDKDHWKGLPKELYVIGLWILAVMFVALGHWFRKTTYIATRTPPEQ